MNKIIYFFFSLICVLFSLEIWAQASEGPNSGSTFSNEVFFGSSASWTNVDSAGASDNERVSISGALSTNGAYTDVFQATDFGFSIPLNSTVNGIVVEVERSDINNAKDNFIGIIKGGSSGSENKSVNPAWSAEVYQDYGSSTDLWSESWNPQDINASDFGVAISVKKQGGGANPEPKIDHIRITVHYTEWLLPIELVKFNAEILESGVFLTWQTAAEINNDYFTLERSSNLKTWEELSRIKGAGNSSDFINYQIFDNSPLKGMSYYRLKQTDFDGDSETFEIIPINNTKTTSGELFSIFPSPAKSILNIEGITVNFSNIQISSWIGKDVKDKVKLVYQSSENQSMILDIKNLTPGIYIIKSINGEEIFFKL